jgi:REP element-mobilizing transposase RayT
MPRKARIDAPGALQHIIIRGIERKEIHRDAKDKNVFLKRFGKVILESSTACYAWALMDNHAHLLLRTGATPIATVMRRVLTGYAQYFNRRHKRHGQLFQNRYKSILCEEDPYFLELVRYIHLNPVRAGMVKSLKALNGYRFSGHAVLMGKRDQEWQDRKYVLRHFGQTEVDAVKGYLAFVRKGMDQGKRPELTGGGLIRSAGGWVAVKALRSAGTRMKGDERILGSGEFVENALKLAKEAYERRTRLRMQGITLEKLIKKVADYHKLDPDELSTNSKVAQVSNARAVLCYLCVREFGYSCAEVASRLNVSPSTVSKAAARGRDKVEDEMIERIMK